MQQASRLSPLPPEQTQKHHKKEIYHKYTYFPPQLWYVNFMKQIVKNCLGFVNNFPKFKQNLATPEKQTADAFYVCVI